MKRVLQNRLSFLGAGVGLALFVVFGLLPGAFLGGVLGLNAAGAIFGMPVAGTLLARIVVAIGMLVGAAVAGLMFTAAGASAGWLAGMAVDSLSGEPEAARAHR